MDSLFNNTDSLRGSMILQLLQKMKNLEFRIEGLFGLSLNLMFMEQQGGCIVIFRNLVM